MKPESEYMLYKSGDKNYLLPFGQNIVLHKRALELNDTGVRLWNALAHHENEEELLLFLSDYYGLSGENHPALEEDLLVFLNRLRESAILPPKIALPRCTAKLNIGGLAIRYYGPKDLLHPNLMEFLCEEHSLTGQNWFVIGIPPTSYPTGNIIIRNHEIEIIQTKESYVIFLYTEPSIQIELSLDGENAYFHCRPSYDKKLIESLFHAFRHAFLFYGQKHGRFIIHSASVLHKGKALLFSAPSGTGKSTLSSSWKELFQTPVLNGDLNLLWMDGTPMVSGLPWCGTSGCYSNETHPLGAIILLKQGHENRIEPLTQTEQTLGIAKRLISPAWTEEMLRINLDFSRTIAEQALAIRYFCKDEPEAAEKLKEYLIGVTG